MTNPAGAWITHALCAQVDTDIFFPPKGGSVTEAKRICAACPVADHCLATALDADLDGIWGGTSRKERRTLRARNKTTA